ncbi:MAG: T9SS type A sorting domain-containing protein [Taibaiella sp.]|jgi:hypothetical protein
MRKIFLFLSCSAITLSSMAQTPIKKSISLVHKITATWCGPCGDWGWTAANSIISGTTDKALYIGLFASSNPSYGNTDFYNATAATLTSQFAAENGIPEFGVNGISSTQNFTSGVESDCINKATTFAATIPTASAASNMSINGNTVTVKAKAQFWSATSGEYYLAAYIVEEGAMHIQNEQGSAAVAHHGVLRTSMTAASAWGEQIANGSVTENQTFSKNFTFTVTDPKWDKTKLKIYNVIWKKEAGVYKFVNVSLNSAATSIDDVINSTSLNVFPNPVASTLHVNMDVVKAITATFVISDVTGRQLNSNTTSLKEGTNHQTINTASLTPGIYFLDIQTENGSTQKKFVKE